MQQVAFPSDPLQLVYCTFQICFHVKSSLALKLIDKRIRSVLLRGRFMFAKLSAASIFLLGADNGGDKLPS
jgi:hypothetical protein